MMTSITFSMLGYAIGIWERGSSAVSGTLARYRERARAQDRVREARLAQANRQAGTRMQRRRQPPGQPPQGQAERRASTTTTKGEGEGTETKFPSS